MKLVFLLTVSIVMSSCSVFGVQDIEEPQYQLLKNEQDIELRQYESQIVAQTYVVAPYEKAVREGFRILANYIFGDNQSKTSISMTAPVALKPQNENIAMTAPVLQKKEGEGWWIQFTMPSKWTLETLPKPNDDRVKFEKVARKLMLVSSFTWRADDDSIDEHRDLLLQALERDFMDYEKIGVAALAGYNPPWTIPFLRRNEVMFEVKKKMSS